MAYFNGKEILFSPQIIAGEGGADIEVDQTYTPESPNAQSGIAVAEAVAPKMDKFADVTIEKQGDKIKKVLLDILGDFDDSTYSSEFELAYVPNKDNGDDTTSRILLKYNKAILESRYCAELIGGYGRSKIQIFTDHALDSSHLLEEWEMRNKPATQIISNLLLLTEEDGQSPVRILNVADPVKDLDVANKQYVDNAAKTKTQTFANGETITITDNTEYIANEEITNLTIIYPNTDFICSLNFTLASTGNITITLPESKYIGSVPSFSYGETWELNIKNGVVVGGKVE